MATQCRGTKTKRINRHKLAVIQAYIIIGTLVLIGFIGGLVVGRATAPKKQVTVTETVEVPSYEADSLPVAEEVTYFDVPLSHSLQRYIYEVCADENVPVSLIIAMIDQESKFNPEVVSKTGDYGLMQINTINHEWLAEEYRTADMLDPYPTIAKKLGISVNTVAKYVVALEEHGLIRTERTEIITKDGHKRNGCLRYTILPIKNALGLCYERQMEKAAQALERQRAQTSAEKLGVQFVPADDEQSA